MPFFKVSGYVIVEAVDANDAKFAFAHIMSNNDLHLVSNQIGDPVDMEGWGYGESVEVTEQQMAELEMDHTHDPKHPEEPLGPDDVTAAILPFVRPSPIPQSP